MCINRTTATAVRHGPASLGGMQVPNLETEQAVEHAKLMVSHLRKDDEIGRMLQTSIDHLQLQAGTSWAVLSQPGNKARKYVDRCYASTTWEFLDKIGIHIRMEPTTWMQPQRIGDRFIMDDVAKLSGIKPIDLVYVQRVRLFLGVTTLADISSSDGKTLCDWALTVDENPRKPVFQFPLQERPTAPYVIATWQRIIRLCYAPLETTVLERPMGKWYKGCINQVWDTVMDPTNNTVYMWLNGQVRTYTR